MLSYWKRKTKIPVSPIVLHYLQRYYRDLDHIRESAIGHRVLVPVHTLDLVPRPGAGVAQDIDAVNILDLIIDRDALGLVLIIDRDVLIHGGLANRNVVPDLSLTDDIDLERPNLDV